MKEKNHNRLFFIIAMELRTVACQLLSGLHYFPSRDLRTDRQFQ